MSTKVTRLEVRQRIFSQEKPFCLVDINRRLNKIEETDSELILSVLDQMFDEGLVSYGELPEKQGNTNWAFFVDNDIMEKPVRK